MIFLNFRSFRTWYISLVWVGFNHPSSLLSSQLLPQLFSRPAYQVAIIILYIVPHIWCWCSYHKRKLLICWGQRLWRTSTRNWTLPTTMTITTVLKFRLVPQWQNWLRCCNPIDNRFYHLPHMPIYYEVDHRWPSRDIHQHPRWAVCWEVIHHHRYTQLRHRPF